MAKVWLFQKPEQWKKLGEDACRWSVGWYDPEGKRHSKKVGTHSAAEKYRRKLEGQLAAGLYDVMPRKSWGDFRAEWEKKIGAGMKPESRRCTLDALRHFERIIKPARVAAVKTATIDQFIATRRKEPGQKKATLSPATVNKELRHLRAVLQIAVDWGYLAKRPKFRMVKEPGKLIQFVLEKDFARIYDACDVAKRPESDAYTPADWWRALITFGYLSGWRVSEITALRWEDVSLDNATAITRAEDNKGGRTEIVPLHAIVVAHLRTLIDLFSPLVFYWPHHSSTLWTDFHQIQRSAGIHLDCHKSHVHSPTCHVYGFHDLRRAFATSNAAGLSAPTLQRLMRHKEFSTTMRYINMAGQVDGAMGKLFIPDFLRPKPEEPDQEEEG